MASRSDSAATKRERRLAWLVRLRVYMAKRDPYPCEEWAWKK